MSSGSVQIQSPIRRWPPSQPNISFLSEQISVQIQLTARYGDIVFALSVGLSAGLMRIREEESLKRIGLPSSSMVISPAQEARIAELKTTVPDNEAATSRSRPSTYADLRKGFDLKGDMLEEHHRQWTGSSRLDPKDKIPMQDIVLLFRDRVQEAVIDWWRGESFETPHID